MASRTKDASLGEHLQLAGAIQANKGEMPHLDGLFDKYLGAVDSFQQAAQVQSALVASKQDASKKVTSTRTEANRIGTIIKATLRDHYGADSEKLIEFGLQPFRGRARKAKPVEEVPEVIRTASPSNDGRQ